MTRGDISARIDGLFIGKVEHRWNGRDPSAIGKRAVSGLWQIDENGFVEDAQADLENHGGYDKAIHHYAADHYPSWISEGEIPERTLPAAFGENISSCGLTEETLCIGDILRLGTAVVQISQGRQPCWKVSVHTRNERMAYLFQKTGRTGWYYRVLENGKAGVGDDVKLIERAQPDWSVKRVTAARLTRRVSEEEAAALAVMPELAGGWRTAFAKMASGDRTEDTTRRLGG
ncbi:MOSC domain-containing protein [uncultured Roseovarius sp.]|uniref:MOSC domain-containing protein n=1 Tax=uncultured Roseovarius sp. TaxID=293344 RepID=UPI0026328284|nr:MOSC domain-containing protein [uncultured Roseovarius sp.]